LKKTIITALVLFSFLSFTVTGQENSMGYEVSCSMDWIRGELNAQVSYNLARAGIRLPTGRFQGEEILKDAYPPLLRPYLLSIPVDSGSTIGSLVSDGEISLYDVDRYSREALISPPSLSPDFSRMIGRYTVYLEKISSDLTRHRRAIEGERPLIPVPAADYTGIIIIAHGELPIRGMNSRALVQPCLFPKIWDTSMNLIYERSMAEPGRRMVRYAAQESIFRPTPSGLDGDLAVLLGPNPLRIIARGIFGSRPTNPIIDRDDARRIISTENNRRLLREGKVLLVLNEEVLRAIPQ